ncbi:hypothetical protein BXU11_16850 [Flavobacterium sp. LM5]|uniref:hypothetical protein n=1 Tax=Flavobacterium sp. LM5 TaxID=1938610 RepID=UPI0009CC1A0E|nr:hypothetical protein [Flavobacterium sp. LM5]OOV21423.1 hypothetical protein BXU11_16850 [Flavobacterium sp. LM5]
MASFPSLQKVWLATSTTVLRFPLEFVVTLLGTLFALLMVKNNYATAEEAQMIKTIMSCSLCLVWFFVLHAVF